jgi:hypothetical protein
LRGLYRGQILFFATSTIFTWTGSGLRSPVIFKADQFKGKVQNAVGGLKDTLRGK